jgi:hypothetical protein
VRRARIIGLSVGISRNTQVVHAEPARQVTPLDVVADANDLKLMMG